MKKRKKIQICVYNSIVMPLEAFLCIKPLTVLGKIQNFKFSERSTFKNTVFSEEVEKVEKFNIAPTRELLNTAPNPKGIKSYACHRSAFQHAWASNN